MKLCLSQSAILDFLNLAATFKFASQSLPRPLQHFPGFFFLHSEPSAFLRFFFFSDAYLTLLPQQKNGSQQVVRNGGKSN